MENGYGAPFIRLYFKDKELDHAIERFKYVYDEENPDECQITVRSDDPNIADAPEFQTDAGLKVVWGYIGGETISRKIYVQDLEPTFDKEGISIEIKATDKSIAMRKANSHKLHKRGDALGIASDLANKHGLAAYIICGDDNTADISKLLKELKDPKRFKGKKVTTALDFLWGALFSDKQREELKKDFSSDNINRQLQKVAFAAEEGVGFNRGIAPTRLFLNNYDDFVKDLDAYRKQNRVPPPEFFKKNPYYTEVYLKALKAKMEQEGGEQTPQAGRSDHQLLRDKLNSLDNTPYVLDTRDDELVIRKRNFTQAPYKKYTYAGPIGDLLSFTPMTKSKTKSDTTSAVGYGSWNATDKTFNSAKVDASTSGSPTNLSTYTSVDLDKIILPQVSMGREVGTSTPAVSTQVLKGFVIKKFANESNDQFAKNMLGPRGNANSAQNVRDNSELKYNPGKALLIGDPNITVGQIHTFDNVSKKYSGNYYCTKSTHDIDGNSGYYVALELTRQGLNLRANNSRVSSKEAQRSINKQLGVDNNSVRKRLKQARNKR